MQLGLSISLTAQRGGFPALSTLGAGQWFARAAQLGDRGYSNFGATAFDTEVDPWDDTGRTYVEIRANPARGAGGVTGAWGYRLWADGARSPETVGETPSALPIWISEGERTGLSNFSGALSVWVQPMYCADLANRDVLANWTVAGEAKQVFIPPAASTLVAEDWAVEAYAPDTGVAGFLVSGSALESAVFVYATDAASPDNTVEHWTALTPIIDGEGAVTGWYGLGTAGATRDVTIIYQTATTKTSAPSDTKSVTLPDTPADFVTGNVTLADDPSPGGNRLAATLVAIPDAGGLPATVEYAIDAGSGFGATQDGGAATAGRVFSITTLAETGTTARFRLRTAYGVSGWLSVGPVTPTIDATESFVIEAASTVGTGEMLYMQADPATLESLAAQTPYSLSEFRHRASYRWEFAEGDTGEDYDWTYMPAWALVPARAGTATGPFAAHTYITPGAKTLRCTIQCGDQEWQATKTVTVSERSYSSANTGLLDVSETPDWTDGSPPAHDVGNRFTDPAAAFTWWFGAPGRCLLMRRGTEIDFPTVGKNVGGGAMLGAYGLASAPPKLIVKFDRGTAATAGNVTLWGTPLLDVTATTGQTVFTPSIAIPGRIYVYKDGVRLAAGEMSFDATDITLTTPCAGGERIMAFGWSADLRNNPLVGFDATVPRVDAVATEGQTEFTLEGSTFGWDVDVEINGVRTLARTLSEDRQTVTLDTPATAGDTVKIWAHGGLEAAGGTDLFEVRDGAGVLFRDFEVEAEPDYYYDPSDPPAFDPENLSSFPHQTLVSVITFGGSQGGQNIFRVAMRGLSTFSKGYPGDYSGMVDCHATDWQNWGGSFWQRSKYAAMVGCAIYQNPGALNGPGGKSWAVPGLPVYSDHSSYRGADNVGQVINRCVLSAWNSWDPPSMIEDANIAQPVIRINQGNVYDTGSFSVTEVFGLGGVQFVTSGQASDLKKLSSVDCGYIANNIWIGTRRSANNQVIDNLHFFSTQNNLFVLPSPEGDSSTGFEVFSVESAAGKYFTPVELADKAPIALNDTYAILANAPTRTLTLSKDHPMQQAGLIGLVSPEAGFAPTAGSNSVVVPIDVNFDVGGGNGFLRVWRAPDGVLANATSFATVAVHEAAYTLSPFTRGRVEGDLTITLASGTFGSGERIWVTSEPEMDDAGTLPSNNRATPLVMPAPVLENPLIVVDGDWSAFRITEGDALLDPADYRSSRFGTFDGLWRPQAGHSVPLATGFLTQTDLRGDDRATPLIGAMEQTTDLSDLVSTVMLESPDVTVAWAEQIYNDGDTVDGADIVATIVDAGQPALGANDLVKTLYVNGAAVAGPVTVTEGDQISGKVYYHHPLAGRQVEQLGSKTVQAGVPTFTSETVVNNAASYVKVLNASNPAGPWHFAMRFQPFGQAGLQGIVNGSDGIDIRLSSGGADVQFRHNDVWLADSIYDAHGLWVSMLVSIFPAADGGPGGDQHIDGWYKLDSGAWTRLTSLGNTMASTDLTTGAIWFFANATPNIADVIVDTQLGLWAGGVPTYTDFFESDGTPRNWTADPSLNVSGMTAQYLWSGLNQFNDPANSNSGGGAGTITREGTAFTSTRA